MMLRRSLEIISRKRVVYCQMDSKQKKLLAISVASNMATKLGIPKIQQALIADLIESILWKQDEIAEVETDEDNY